MYKYPINQIYFCFYFFKTGGNMDIYVSFV